MPHNAFVELAVFRRITDIRPAAQYCTGHSSCPYHRPLSDSIDSPCQPADGTHACGCQCGGELLRHICAVGRTDSRPDHSHRRKPFIRKLSLHIDGLRPVRKRKKPLWIKRIRCRIQIHSSALQRFVLLADMRPAPCGHKLLLLSRRKQQLQLLLIQIKNAFRTAHRVHQPPDGSASYSFYII